MTAHGFDVLGTCSRRSFLGGVSGTVGLTALNALLADEAGTAALHFAPKAKRVIYLFQSGAPSQLELFDHKPGLEQRRGTDLPESIRQGQRLTGMTAGQDKFPIVPSMFKFSRHGQSGATISEL